MSGRDVASAMVVVTLWGCAFVAMRVGLHSLPPLLFAALRFSVVALPVVALRRGPDVSWAWIVTIGLSLWTTQFGCLFVGIDLGLPAGLASLVLQAQVAFTLLLAVLILRERPTARQLGGIGVCFLALAGIAAERATDRASLTGFMVVLVGAVGFAVGNVAIRMSGSRRPFELMLWTSLIAPVPLLLLSWIFEGAAAITRGLTGMSADAVAAVLYVAVSTLVGFGLWSRLIGRYGPTVVAPFGLLIPLIGIGSTALVMRERVTLLDCCAGLLALGGLYFVISPSRRSVATPMSRI